MSDPVFWAPTGDLAGDLVVLDGAEGHHAAGVRRLRTGERVVVTDGSGLAVRGQVVDVGRASLTVAVTARWTEPEPPLRVIVAQAIPKGERAETAVETLTEVGVDELIPWQAARCVAQWQGDRGERALSRWRATAREAAKQSRRVRWPEVGEPLDTPGLVRRAASVVAAGGQVLLLDEVATTSLSSVLRPGSPEVLLVVGPEGGIDASELAGLRGAGGTDVRLGPSVLRTSTAGTVAAAVVLAASSRWS